MRSGTRRAAWHSGRAHKLLKPKDAQKEPASVSTEQPLLRVTRGSIHVMQSRIGSFFVATISLMVVIAAMAALDEGVRIQVMSLLGGDMSHLSAFADGRIQDGTRAVHGFAFQASG